MTLSHATTRLVALTETIADPGDLLASRGRDGFVFLDGATGFATAGVAARVAPDDVHATLSSIAHEQDGPGGPRAVGALPFAGDGTLVVPARIVAREADGTAWRTTITGVDAPPDTASGAPTRFSVAPRRDRAGWTAMVEKALAEITSGAIEKVVLARTVDVTADTPFSVRAVLDTLRRTRPGCTGSADGGFVGASPELLVRRTGRDVVSRPMAGTGSDPAQLLASAKDAWEHQIVVDAVMHAFGDARADGPTAMRFADVTHLATSIHTQLVDDDVTALDLARRLHPTPAVGGRPDSNALELLRTLEGEDRDRYAGPCGWVDAAGDGAFVVSLRCARLDGTRARLYAGAGIVAGSEPGAEWAETQAKLEPMLRALVRP